MIATMNRFSNAKISADNNRKALCFTLEIQELLPKLAAKQPSHYTHTATPERMEAFPMLNRWARSFTVTDEDIEYLMNLLLERETPMTTRELAKILVENRLNQEKNALEERYQGTKVYNTAHA